MKTTGSAADTMQVQDTAMPLLSVNSTLRLDSWKDIASYFRRSVRTVQRWEQVEGMPVHRHAHDKGDTLFAYTQELDEWQKSRGHVGAKQVAVASVQCPSQGLPIEEQAGLRRLLERALEQFYKAPACSAFVVVFYGTLARSGNEGLDLPADPRTAGDQWQSY
jgi:hypothetical protein